MGTVRTKGHEHSPPPLYSPESADITLVLHYGGQFISKPTVDYIGGDKVVYDYINIFDCVNIANLSRWCEGLGVLGEKRFYGILGNGFKLLWNDYELIKWARECDSSKQVHVWVEGSVQKDIAQSQVHKGSETFELHEDCGNLEVQKGSDEYLLSEGRDEGEMPEGSGYAVVHEGSPLSSLIDSDNEFESTDDKVGNEVNLNVAFEVGMVFETKNEFKKAIKSHALQTERSLHFVKNDNKRVYVRCRNDGCDWGINLVKRVNECIFRIRSYKPFHKCAPGDEDAVYDGDDFDGDDFDETRIYDDPFEVGMVFETKSEFKKAIQSHAMQTKRSLHFKKNDKRRVYVRCRGDGCDWGINLIKRVNESTFQITSYKPAHNCAPALAIRILKSEWLGEKYVSAFQNDPKRSVAGWRKDIMREMRVNVSQWQAYRAKRKALEIIERFPDKQYPKLCGYAQKLKRRKCAHHYSSGTQVSGGEENVKNDVGGEKDVQVEKELEEPVRFTRSQKLKVSRKKSASTSGVTHANATNQEKGLIVSGPLTRAKTSERPPTRGKTRGRPPKVNRNKSVSTTGVTHANATNQEEDIIVSGPLTRAKTRGRPPTRGKTRGRPPKVSKDNSTSTSGVIHANAINQEEDFIVNVPPTRRKSRGRPPKVRRDKSASTSGVVHANATNQAEEFIVSGPLTRGKTRGRPPKLNIDNNSIRPPKSTLGLVDEDEDDEFEALLGHASSAANATGLGMTIVSCTSRRTPYQQSLAPPPFLRRNLKRRKHI